MTAIQKAKQHRKQSSIPFYPELIPKLKEEHHILKQHLWRIQKFLEEKNYVDAAAAIDEYRSLGLKHSSEENIKIYAYLRLVYLDEDPPIEAVKLRAMRKKADLALITMFDFCEEYRDFAKDEQKQKGVYPAFCEAKQLFLEKMHMEESTIYPLYLQNPK